ncbi:Transglutaminase-like superfamily protein [Verrucomicrobium sp. GAS474]|nr:Transglutaminase-like superfamily protein [Verrucomicrobium sp. GAS474]
MDHGDADATVLLEEVLTYVNEDGSRVSAYHSVYKAWNDAGAKAIAQGSFTYKKKFQRAYLVSAQTIQPDKMRTAVTSDAVFVKTPQNEIADSIYNDQLDLVTVYSNIKPGSITESLIVLEDTEPRIPGEYSQTFTWKGSWPEYLQRLVVDLPSTYSKRLTITNLGQAIPTPAKVEAGAGRQQLTWEKLETAADPWSETRAPSYQIGPTLWLSTLKDWDTFAAWYEDLTRNTVTLNAALKGKIDEWTRTAKEPGEILGILYGHVAQDIRYTAFELDQSDFRPHDPMDVWNRQYGDCKDKANLLRAMLAYKGIPAWLTLLTTEHSGLINKASPDYRHFNHCILAAQVGKETVFCDPTITYGTPGLLSGSESDRDVLVVKKGKAAWIRTPPFRDAAVTYSFDLKLRPDGDLAGWIKVDAAGYYRASYREYYGGLPKDQLLSRIQETVQGFFPRATVADVELLGESSPKNAPDSFSLRAYMTLGGVGNTGDEASSLRFPSPDSLLPDLKDYKTRRNTTFLWPDSQRITCRIELLPGSEAGRLGDPLLSRSPGFTFQSSWSTKEGVLTGNCKVTLEKSLFQPEELRSLGDMAGNLRNWAAKPLALSKVKGDVPGIPAQTDAELATSLPLMPTGEGQLTLIDSEFPDDGNVVARRAALERIPAIFPTDKKTIAIASIKLAILEYNVENWDGVLSRLKPALEANRAALDPTTIAWAEYLQATALLGLGKKEEALALFQGISENNTVSSGRRGWAIYKTATILADTASPKAALDYADKGLLLESDAAPSLYAFYALTALNQGDGPRLKDRLSVLIASKSESIQNTLLEVTSTSRKFVNAGEEKKSLELLTLLDSLATPDQNGGPLGKALKKAREDAESASHHLALQAGLKELLANSPDIVAFEKKQPSFSSIAEAKKAMAQHDESGEPDDALGCAVRLATSYPPDGDFTEYLWNCASDAEWSLRYAPSPAKESFFLGLVKLADALPHSSEVYVDIEILHAKVLEKKNLLAEAGDLYATLTQIDGTPDGFRGPLALKSGVNWESRGNYEKALACYQTAEPWADRQTSAQEALLRATFIRFDDGNKAEALRLLRLLKAANKKNLLKSGEQVKNVLAGLQDSYDSPSFWNNWNAWWPQWQKLEAFAGLEPLTDRKVVPIIPSLTSLGKSLGEAKRNKDTKQAFTLLRQLAYAARFYPNAALEFVGVFGTAEDLLPDHANDLRLLAISILTPFSPQDTKDRQIRALHLIANYVDANQGDKALDLMAKEWSPSLDDNTKLTLAIHRVWGLAALQQHRDLDKVTTVLEQDIKASPKADTSSTVTILTDLYLALGRQSDATSALDACIANPATGAKTQQELKERLENLRNTSLASKQLADGAAAWLKDHKPSWWDYAEPKSPDDPRLLRLDQILDRSQEEFQPAEWVKAAFLAPSVPALTANTQQQALLKGFSQLLSVCKSQADANALAQSILDNPSFPKPVKADFLYDFLWDAYTNWHPEVFEHFRKSPSYETMTPAQQTKIERIVAYMKTDKSSPAALRGYIQKQAEGPMDALSLDLVQNALFYILQSLDLDSAQAIYQAAASYTLTADAGQTKPEFQLKLLKQINLTKPYAPIITTLRKECLAWRAPSSISKPPTFDQRRDFGNFNDLSQEDAIAFRLYLIKSAQDPVDLEFWEDLFSDLSHSDAGGKAVLRLLQAGLQSTEDDDFTSYLVSAGDYALDIDNTETRQKFLDIVKPYRNAAKFPQTVERLSLIDAQIALRSGNPINLEFALANLADPYNINKANRLRIRSYLQTKNTAKLKKTLAALSSDQMTSSQLNEEILPALELVGMRDEAALTRDVLARNFYQDILRAWFSPQGALLNTVESDLSGLGTPEKIPDAFTGFMETKIARQRSLLRYKLSKAYFEKNWAKAADAGTAYVQSNPTFYTAYWFLGRSLAELGRKEEAIKALNVYCRYSLNEVRYPDAKLLLETLSEPQK